MEVLLTENQTKSTFKQGTQSEKLTRHKMMSVTGDNGVFKEPEWFLYIGLYLRRQQKSSGNRHIFSVSLDRKRGIREEH